MVKLRKYLKGYIKESILGPVFKLCEATLELIVPLIIAIIVDKGINGTGDARDSVAIWYSLLLVGLGVVGLVFSVTAQYYCAKAAVGFSARIRYALFGKIQTLSYSDLDRLGTSTLITRMTADTTKVQNGLNLALRLLLRSPFIVFGAMIMAFTVDVKSATIFAISIPILALIVFAILLISIPLYKRVQKDTDGVLEKTRENLSGVRVIRAFRKEEDERREFAGRNSTLAARQKRVGAISALMNPLTYVIINLAILALIHTGALRIDQPESGMTTGKLLALYNYMSQILVELIKLANLIITVTRALASGSRIRDTLNLSSTESVGKETQGIGAEYLLEFDSVGLKYSGSGESSLENISFKVRAGETVGIIGGTGSGKTSLVNMIPAFYLPSEGRLLIDGVPVSEYSPEYLRENIGFVPQNAVLFRGSIRENLLWGDKNATDGELWEALKVACCEKIVKEKGGLDAMIEEGGRNLSGGQRQRLTIARALVGRPKIVIFDDSSSALDYATDAELRKNLKEMKGETTLFIVSQRASSVLDSDKIVVLEDGRAVDVGTHKELLDSSEVYKEIYYSQFEPEVRGEEKI